MGNGYLALKIDNRKNRTISFNDDGVITSSVVIDGETVVKPTDPTKAGYIFKGWYTESTFENLFNFSTAITSDLTLYAKFEVIPPDPVTPPVTSPAGPTTTPASSASSKPKPSSNDQRANTVSQDQEDVLGNDEEAKDDMKEEKSKRSRVDMGEEELNILHNQIFSRAIVTVKKGLCDDIEKIKTVSVDGVEAGNTEILAGLEFNLVCSELGEGAEVEIVLGQYYADTAKLKVFKGSGSELKDITKQVKLTNKQIDSEDRTILAYSLVDGGEMDGDMTENANIDDPIYIGVEKGSPAWLKVLLTIIALLLIVAIAYTKRRKAQAGR